MRMTNEEIEKLDEVLQIQLYIEHHEADLRAHAKEVRRKTAIAKEDIKKIENERYKGMGTLLEGEIF
jgi:hypothetical protein